MIYLISDTHFGHNNIIKYCGRPFKDVQEMNEIIIKNWNNIVDWDDIVFHLGDFSLGHVQEISDRLNGKIIPIKGNHDDRSWSCIESMIIQTHGETFELCHDPAVSRADIVLCGHHHEQWVHQIWKNRIIINLSVEQWNYMPVSIETVIKFLNKIRLHIAQCKLIGKPIFMELKSDEYSIGRNMGAGISSGEETPILGGELRQTSDPSGSAGIAGHRCN